MPHSALVDVTLAGGSRFVVSRDVDLANGSHNVDLDLTTSNSMESGTYTFDTVDPDESIVSYSTFTTKNLTVSLFNGDAGTFMLPSPADRIDGDIPLAILEATTPTFITRSVSYRADQTYPDHWTWLPRVVPPALEPTTHISLAPMAFSYTGAELGCSDLVSHEFVFASSAWLTNYGQSMGLDTGVPGWNQTWTLGASRTCNLNLEQRQSADVVKYTGAQLN